MKKIICILFIISFNTTFAQTRVNFSTLSHHDLFSFNTPVCHAPLSKTSVNSWYCPLQYDTFSGPHVKTYLGFMMHDSLAKLFYADGSSESNRFLSFGRVLDPKDTNIAISGNPTMQLSNYTGYSLDSVRFNYAYIRNVNILGGLSVKDTLFICYFTGKQITKHTFTSNNSKFAIVDWTGDSFRMPLNYLTVDTIILSNSDSTGFAGINGGFENYFNVKTFARKVPSGVVVDAQNAANVNNLVAFTVTFKSAVPSVYSTDTAIMIYQKNPSTMPSGSHRTNFFGFMYAVSTDTASWSNPKYYNTSLLAPSWASYTESNGWLGYVAGNAYAQEYFIQADFKITSTANAGMNTLDRMNEPGFIIFPNPAGTGNIITAGPFDKDLSNMEVGIYNLTGKKLQHTQSEMMENGKKFIQINSDELSNGIYVLKFLVNGYIMNRKLILF